MRPDRNTVRLTGLLGIINIALMTSTAFSQTLAHGPLREYLPSLKNQGGGLFGKSLLTATASHHQAVWAIQAGGHAYRKVAAQKRFYWFTQIHYGNSPRGFLPNCSTTTPHPAILALGQVAGHVVAYRMPLGPCRLAR